VDHTAGRAVAEAHTIEVEARSRLRRNSGAGNEDDADGEQQPSSGRGGAGRWAGARAWSPATAWWKRRKGMATSFLMGVQWHPERVLEENKAAQCLFQSFVDAAAALGAAA